MNGEQVWCEPFAGVDDFAEVHDTGALQRSGTTRNDGLGSSSLPRAVTYNRTMHAEYDALLADLLDACRRHYGGRLVAVVVYGSVGRGTPRFDSDIDVLIVANGLPAGRFPRVDDFRAVEQALARRLKAARDAGLHPELSPIFKTPEELVRGTPLLLDMTEDARILQDTDGCSRVCSTA